MEDINENLKKENVKTDLIFQDEIYYDKNIDRTKFFKRGKKL